MRNLQILAAVAAMLCAGPSGLGPTGAPQPLKSKHPGSWPGRMYWRS